MKHLRFENYIFDLDEIKSVVFSETLRKIVVHFSDERDQIYLDLEEMIHNRSAFKFFENEEILNVETMNKNEEYAGLISINMKEIAAKKLEFVIWKKKLFYYYFKVEIDEIDYFFKMKKSIYKSMLAFIDEIIKPKL